MRVLLPTDGSRYALAAARALSMWFAWPGGEVDVLVITPEEPKSDHRDFGKDTEAGRDWKATAGRWLADTVAHLHGSGLRVREIVRSGDPAPVAVETAGASYDLVAVGAKGRGEAPFFDTGSVAQALLQHAPTSILMVRERAPHGRGRRRPTPQHPLRALLAVDGGDSSDVAARVYSRLAKPDRVETTVLAVADSEDGTALDESDASSAAEKTASMLEHEGFTVRRKVAAGNVAERMLEAADDADLVVAGSALGGTLGASESGSIGLDVATSSPCSVLLVRQAAPPVVAASGESQEPAIPLEIAYENMEPSPAAEERVLRGVRRLERVASDLMGVRVTVGQRNPRQATGNLYDVHLELMLPGPDVVVSRTPSLHHESESLVTALGEAFERARRELVERGAKERGDVKAHEPEQRGEVTDLFPDYGFIRGSDGRIVYFHRNSVLDAAWEGLEVGTEVRFADEPGQEGPHASSVTVLRPR